jgi:hypothetical protein
MMATATMMLAALADVAAAQTRRFAVIVGVADYQNFEGLDYADTDASSFRSALLVDPRWSTLGNVQLLLNSQATKANVQAALASVASQADADDIVVFFYSGHGASDTDVAPLDETDDLDEYLCPYDSLLSSYAQDIRDDELSNWLGAIHAGSVVVILDTCFSGGMGDNVSLAELVDGPRVKTLTPDQKAGLAGDGMAEDLQRGPATDDGDVTALLDAPTNTVVLTASAEDQYSFELSSLSHGVFTYYVLDAMAKVGGDADRSWNLSAEELFAYAGPRVAELLLYASTQDYQTPQLYDGKAGQADFVASTTTLVAPSTILNLTMDSNPGWVFTAPWAHGTPLGSGGSSGDPDPTSGCTGTKVIGYNLSGDYGNNLTARSVTSSVINCSAYSRVVVRYYRWLGVEGNAYDHARFQVSSNGSTYNTVWENGSYDLAGGRWVREEFDISSFAANKSTVYLRWIMGATDSSGIFCGWNIDDLTVLGTNSVSYTLAKSPSTAGAGTVTASPSQTTFTAGAAVTLTATANTGWTFTGWSGLPSGATVGTDPQTVCFLMTGNVSAVANFTSLTLTTAASPAAGGAVTVSPNRTNFAVGETVTVTASANAGWTFTGWTGLPAGATVSGDGLTATFTMTADTAVAAGFTAYALTVNFNATAGTVTRNPDRSWFAPGETVTLTAGATSGYQFDGWAVSGGGTVLNPTSSTISVIISADTTVTASFRTAAETSERVTIYCNDDLWFTVPGDTLPATLPAEHRYGVEYQNRSTSAVSQAVVTLNPSTEDTPIEMEGDYAWFRSVNGAGGSTWRYSQAALPAWAFQHFGLTCGPEPLAFDPPISVTRTVPGPTLTADVQEQAMQVDFQLQEALPAGYDTVVVNLAGQSCLDGLWCELVSVQAPSPFTVNGSSCVAQASQLAVGTNYHFVATVRVHREGNWTGGSLHHKPMVVVCLSADESPTATTGLTASYEFPSGATVEVGSSVARTWQFYAGAGRQVYNLPNVGARVGAAQNLSIDMFRGVDRDMGNRSYAFEADVYGENVCRVTVTTPTAVTFDLWPEEDEWEFSARSLSAADLADFPNGQYTFTVYGTQGDPVATSVMLSGATFSQLPVITAPGYVTSDTTPTIAWELPTEAGVDVVGLYTEWAAGEFEQLLPVDTTSYTFPSDVPVGAAYYSVGFGHLASGTTAEGAGYTASTYISDNRYVNVVPELQVAAALDYDWVYPNTEVTTADRHQSMLAVEITGGAMSGEAYAVTIGQDGGAMSDFIVTQGAPLVSGTPTVVNVVAGRRDTAVIGEHTLNVTVTGAVFGQTAAADVSLTLRLLGDIVADGIVNASDKLEINKKLNGLENLPGIELRDLDLSGDGELVNAEDKLAINQILNGLVVP